MSELEASCVEKLEKEIEVLNGVIKDLKSKHNIVYQDLWGRIKEFQDEVARMDKHILKHSNKKFYL